ncbi:MAG: nitroreductase family protein, partial [Planctomycetia bacterium]|nr:nitroreductase family protein [Planctomycetia bacterium]
MDVRWNLAKRKEGVIVEFLVNRKICTHCSACVRHCVGGVLELQDSWPVVVNEDRCIRCQHCLAICPVGAISIFGRDPVASRTDRSFPTPDQMENLLRWRRSCRDYRHENVNREILDRLLAAMAWVPTGVNDHRLHFSVVDDVTVMDRLRDEFSGIVLRSIREKTLPASLASFSGMESSLELKVDPIFRTAPHLILVSTPPDAPCAATDPTIALSQFELLAQSFGLGTTWAGLVYL